MNSSTNDACRSPLKRRLLIVALMVGLAGGQSGCVCECAGVATAIGVAVPAIWAVREAQEARKTQLEIEQLEAEQCSQGNSP